MATKCLECDEPATWERVTQFAGRHPYCTLHAETETDFGQEDASYFYWRRLDSDKAR